MKVKWWEWGWIEWFIVAQTFLPALLFIPGVATVPGVRPATRISAYALALVAWAWVALRWTPTTGAPKFPAKSWLAFCAGWLVLSLAHPNNYSLATALGQIVLYLSVLSPAFWAGESLKTPGQLTRIMAVLFLCNALSATLGLAQVYSPRFNPPVIPVENMRYGGDNFKVHLADGTTIFRPFGLSDSPGAAAPAGSTAALIGLCFALRPIGLFRRLACVGLAFAGVAVIYFTQIRSVFLMLAICLGVLTVLLLIQKRTANAFTLIAGGMAMVGGSFVWAARRMGSSAFERFGSLATTDYQTLIMSNRGGFVEEALTQVVWDYPIGYGLGWWGMIHLLFNDPSRVSTIWVEVMIQAWAFDGGFPLLIGYCGAIAVAVYQSIRIALSSKDRELSFWAAVVVAQNVSVVASCISYVTFLSPMGIQFWILNAALYAADVQSRAKNPSGSTPRPARRTPRPRPTPPYAGPSA